MATVINNPSGTTDSSGSGALLGILVAVVLGILFFVYLLPAIQGTDRTNTSTTEIKVDLPSTAGTGATGGDTPTNP